MVSNRQRAVVVTGASSGIGEACVLRLDGLGFRVFAGVRRQQDGDALRRKASERLAPVMLDITDPLSAQSASDSVAAATGSVGLAGLVNNAGTAVAAPLEFLPLGELRRQLEVNVVGQIAVTQLPPTAASRQRAHREHRVGQWPDSESSSWGLHGLQVRHGRADRHPPPGA